VSTVVAFTLPDGARDNNPGRRARFLIKEELLLTAHCAQNHVFVG